MANLLPSPSKNMSAFLFISQLDRYWNIWFSDLGMNVDRIFILFLEILAFKIQLCSVNLTLLPFYDVK